MRVLILEVGNILLTGEAIDMRTVKALEQRYILSDYAEILDDGATRMELFNDMANRDYLIIVDAIVSKENAPGTMMILWDEEVPVLFANRISPRQLDLADILSALRFVGELSKKPTLIDVVPESLESYVGLTPAIETTIEPALGQVLAALHEPGVGATPRGAIHN